MELDQNCSYIGGLDTYPQKNVAILFNLTLVIIIILNNNIAQDLFLNIWLKLHVLFLSQNGI